MNRFLPVLAALVICLPACKGGSGDHSTTAAHEATPHWTYTGEGAPDAWSTLSAEFASCSIGGEQSPIDVPVGVTGTAPSLESEYSAVPVRYVFNGHTVQFDGANGGGITVEGRAYALKQFHVHFPSEHHVAGQSYPGEIHFVHADSTGALAVVGVLVVEGAENTVLAPAMAGLVGLAEGVTAAPEATIDPDDLMPEGGYRAYSGSLTTPPCSEGVQWFVLDAPIQLSKAQIDAFATVTGVSNRPVQPLGDRVVAAGMLD